MSFNLPESNRKFNKTIGFGGSDYVCTQGGSNHLQIDAAINEANAAGGGDLWMTPGVFTISAHSINKSNVRLHGAGIGRTIIQGSANFDYTFYNTSAISDFEISDMTIDVQNGTNASAIQMYSATRCNVRRVQMKNVASGGWMLKIGTANGLTDGITCVDNFIEDCEFDTHAGSLEMLLLFNARNTHIVNPLFKNNDTGPTVGLWQKCYGTKIVKPAFRDNKGSCIYYSITVEDTEIDGAYAENCGNLLDGANISDNGAFGLTQARVLKVLNPVCVGGANSIGGSAIQLGAVDDVLVTNPTIEGYQIGIIFSNGNNAADAPATHWRIVNPQIRNGNLEDAFHILHPGIIFGGIGGSMYGKLEGGAIYDTQGTPTQRYPITFYGGFTYDDIEITGTRLSAYGGGTSIALSGGAALGSNVKIHDNTDYSGTNPGQAVTNSEKVYAQGNVTGSITYDAANGSVITSTATGNLNVTLTSGTYAGQMLTLRITQDGTGGRTITWPSNFKKAGGTLALSLAAGAIDVIVMKYDGTNWVEISRSMNQS